MSRNSSSFDHQRTTATTQSTLEALLSLDQSSRSRNKSVRDSSSKDYNSKRNSSTNTNTNANIITSGAANTNRRLSTSGSRSRDRALNNASDSNYSGSSAISTSSTTGTPPLNSNWLQRERLSAQQQHQSNSGGGVGGGVGGTTSQNSSGWNNGLENLPSNAVAGYSAFNTFSDGSHFFQGSSAFSFEGSSTGGGGGGGDEDSPSLFRDNKFNKTNLRASSRYSTTSESVSKGIGRNTTSSWEQEDLINKRSGIGILGGGRKRKDSSRGMSYIVTTSNMTVDKGLVALAKPMGEGLEGKVAIAGKTCLRILKVPSGERNSTFERPSSSSFKMFSGLAARRSQGRGSPVSLDRNPTLEENKYSEKIDSNGNNTTDIVETLDVRLGSRLGSSFFFSDVKWGFAATSNKLATAFSNGAVILWDLAKEGSSRLDQLKYEHDRAVNKVVFGGASGSWLLSGGQDGQMKLWDIREARPASLVLKASSPVRQLSFSPSASQPFTLLAVCSSGTLIRYDIRYTGRVAGGATDRVAGHVGACLSMDWRDNLPSEQDRAPGGWVVTGGMDSTIKVWDFSLPTLSTKPTTTLFASQPVQSVSWHPSRCTELASSPLPTLSVGLDEGNHSPGVKNVGSIDLNKDSNTLGGLGTTSWKNEIEVWDTRRTFFPKLSIKTDEPISAIVWNDDETIWSTSKSTPTFQQYDINSDSYSLLDSMPLVAASWNVEGELVFVDDPRTIHDIPWDPPDILNNTSISIDSPPFRSESSIASIVNFDPDFSANSFTYLANNLILSGLPLTEICDLNAEASEYVGRSDAAQLWSTIRIWFDESPLFAEEEEDEGIQQTESKYQTPSAPNVTLPPTNLSTPPSRATEWVNQTSPLNTENLNPPNINSLPSIIPSRRSSINPLTRTKSTTDSPIIYPNSSSAADSPRGTMLASPNNLHSRLDDFSEESASEVDIILPPAAMKLPSTTSNNPTNTTTTISTSFTFSKPINNSDQVSSDSDSDLPINTSIVTSSLLTSPKFYAGSTSTVGTSNNNQIGRRGRSMTLGNNTILGTTTPSRLLDSMLDLDAQFQKRSITPMGGKRSQNIPMRGEDDWEFDAPSKNSTPRPLSLDPVLFRKNNKDERPSSDSDDSDNDEDEVNDDKDGEEASEGVIGGASNIGIKSRAAKLLARQTTKSRKNSGGSKSRPSIPTVTAPSASASIILGLSRQSSVTKRNLGSSGLGISDIKIEHVQVGPTLKELKRIEGQKHVLEVKQIVKQQIIAALNDYADKGDSQLCASVCCVLGKQGFNFDLMFVARVTKSYLDLLRRLKLHAAAAGLLKYCTIESLRSQTQNNIVHHMACGKCGKAIEQPPYGTCRKCSNQITRCCICHLIVRSLLLFCPICNHGAHITCVSTTAAILSSRLNSLATTHSHYEREGITPSPDVSHPSTPGLTPGGTINSPSGSGMPAIRAWFWNEDGVAVEETEIGGKESNEEIERKEIENLIGTCPSCSHEGCLLSINYSGE